MRTLSTPATGRLLAMSDPLAWTGAIGGAVAAAGAVIAAIGAWRTEATARWQARVERLRTDQARTENELHRMRHKELYDWWHDMPDGPGRTRAMRWFGEWTGARDPYRGNDQGAMTPGFGCRDADQAYDRYIGFLDAIFHPGRLGPPPRSLATPDGTDQDVPAIDGIDPTICSVSVPADVDQQRQATRTNEQ
jgi:hypothetical protein